MKKNRKKVNFLNVFRALFIVLLILFVLGVNNTINVMAKLDYEIITTSPKDGGSNGGRTGKLKTYQTQYFKGKVQDYIEVPGSSMPLIMQLGITHVPFGSGTIQSNGCGPASAAMVISDLKGQYIPVEEMATRYNAYANPNNGGSGTTLHAAAAKDFGLKQRWTTSRAEAYRAYKNGGKVMVATHEGAAWSPTVAHWVAIREFVTDGKIKINDPASKENTFRSEPFDLAREESRGLIQGYSIIEK